MHNFKLEFSSSQSLFLCPESGLQIIQWRPRCSLNFYDLLGSSVFLRKFLEGTYCAYEQAKSEINAIDELI